MQFSMDMNMFINNVKKIRDYSKGATPVPIPNTAVKSFCADGTWRETARKSRSLRVFSFFKIFILFIAIG